jgi:hypothetical protein
MGVWILLPRTTPILLNSSTPLLRTPDHVSRNVTLLPRRNRRAVNHSLQSAAVWDNGPDRMYACQFHYAL